MEEKQNRICWTGTYFLDDKTGEGRIIIDKPVLHPKKCPGCKKAAS